jgi:hypothetical protein
MPIDPPRELPPYLRPLIETLLEPQRCLTFDVPTWERLIRTARQSRLLGVLSARIARVVPPERIDETIRRHLIAGQVESNFRRHKTRYLLSSIEPHLGAPQTPCILLKGAAYIMQDLALGNGRLPGDVDVMVPRQALGAIEHSLLAAGWQFEKTDPYDQHFYRAWSHELPPLICAGQSLELDLHHTILPPLGRLKPDTKALFEAAIRIPGSRFSALCSADQVLLAAAHLFHDSDCTDRLRDLVDIDGLIREFSVLDARFWQQLLERAQLHNLGRPLWYALGFANGWLSTSIPEDVAGEVERFRPTSISAALWRALMARTLPPVDPDLEQTWTYRKASRLLEGRATWLRMPPGVLAQHIGSKFVRGVTAKLKREPAEVSTE